MTELTQQRKEAFKTYEEFWRELSRQGDPDRIPNKVKRGWDAGWQAGRSSLESENAELRKLLQDFILCAESTGEESLSNHDKWALSEISERARGVISGGTNV